MKRIAILFLIVTINILLVSSCNQPEQITPQKSPKGFIDRENNIQPWDTTTPEFNVIL